MAEGPYVAVLGLPRRAIDPEDNNGHGGIWVEGALRGGRPEGPLRSYTLLYQRGQAHEHENIQGAFAGGLPAGDWLWTCVPYNHAGWCPCSGRVEGAFVDGRLDGGWRYQEAWGPLIEATWRGGVAQGPARYVNNPNGFTETGALVGGQKEGAWIRTDSDGGSVEQLWRGGVLVSEVERAAPEGP